MTRDDQDTPREPTCQLGVHRAQELLILLGEEVDGFDEDLAAHIRSDPDAYKPVLVRALQRALARAAR